MVVRRHMKNVQHPIWIQGHLSCGNKEHCFCILSTQTDLAGPETEPMTFLPRYLSSHNLTIFFLPSFVTTIIALFFLYYESEIR